jgi:hypothetical protein
MYLVYTKDFLTCNHLSLFRPQSIGVGPLATGNPLPAVTEGRPKAVD